jgi:hypothetical protein
MAQVMYNVAKARLANGSLDLDTSTIRMLLLKTTAAGAYSPDLDTVAALLAVGSVAECDFTNYARKTLTVSVTEDDANDRANIDADNQTWTNAGGASNNTPVAAVIYQFGTNDSDSYLIGYYDTGFGSIATNGGNYTVTISDFLRFA